MRRQAPLTIPVAFVVEVAGDVIAPANLVEASVRAPRDPVVKPVAKPVIPKPTIKKPVTAKPAPARAGTVKKASHSMTEAEVRKLLMAGATAGTFTSIPDEDTQGKEQIRKILYGAWVEPSAESAGMSGAWIEIQLADDGRLLSSRLVRSSGNGTLDESVLQAVRSVSIIPGLPRGFIERNRRMTVEFKISRE